MHESLAVSVLHALIYESRHLEVFALILAGLFYFVVRRRQSKRPLILTVVVWSVLQLTAMGYTFWSIKSRPSPAWHP